MWGLDLSGSMQGAGGVGGLLAVNDVANGAHFVAYDGNGNVAVLVKGTDGTISAQYEYGPFAEPIRVTGIMGSTNPIRFSNKYTDDESDFLNYGHRYYNRSTGRWLSRDPIGERAGVGYYLYARNDPVGRFDILGLKDFLHKFGIKQEPWKQGSWEPLQGELSLSESGWGTAASKLEIGIKVTRASSEKDRALWNRIIGWRPYWDSDHKWKWPNLAALLSAKGITDVTRYGGPDPGKDNVDNDFSAVVIRKYTSSASGDVEVDTVGNPLISADWIPEGEGNLTLASISHVAKIREKLVIHPDETKQPCKGSIKVWMTYADFMQSQTDILKNKWPLEFNGTVVAHIKISWNWEKGKEFSPVFETVTTAPPPTGVTYWRYWMDTQFALPRYSDR
jgi:RHS repeat-associated protein